MTNAGVRAIVTLMNETCELCGATGKGTTAWGGWCHDCDNQMSEAGN